MTDRTTKFLLAAIALLLIVLLLRPTAFAPTPAQAQTGSAATRTSGQLVVDKDEVYVLQNGILSAYHVVDGHRKAGADPFAFIRLHRDATQDVSQP